MKTRLAFLIRYLTTAVAATFLVVFALPFVKVIRLWSVLNSAHAGIEANQAREAIASVSPFEPWAAPYPVLRAQFMSASARAHAAAGEFTEARLIAEEIYEQSPPRRKSPPFLADLPVTLMASLVDRSIRLLWKTREPSRWNGYEYLLHEMSNSGGTDAARRLATQLLEKDPEPEMRKKLLAYADARGVAPPATSRAHGADSLSPETPAPAPSLPARRPDPVTARPQRPSADTASWAIISNHQAKAYTAAGKLARSLSPATVLEVSELKDTRSGRLALCRYPSDSQGPPFLVRLRHLDIRSGRLADVDPKLKSLLLRRAKLVAEIARLRALQSARQSDANPHQRDYAAARDAYRDYASRVQSLRSRMDRATGPERMEYADKLRAMIVEGTDLVAKYKRAKAEYDEWNRRRPPEPEPPGAAQLREELAMVAADLERLGVD